jgi:hypothetical protein
LLEAATAEIVEVPAIDAQRLALAALAADPALHPPVPCYLRAPDAKLPS